MACCHASSRAGFLQLAQGSSWDSSKISSSSQPWWVGSSSGQQQWGDALFDAEVDAFLGLRADPQQQQQQQMPTAADWVLGEYADAAQGLHTFSTLDEDDLGATSRPRRQPGSSAGQGVSSSNQPAGAGAAGAAPLELGARDLRQLIRQYSWNTDKPELLQVRHQLLLVLLVPCPCMVLGTVSATVSQVEDNSNATTGLWWW
jgi:hypothetical protein